jgi:hypothetical protein
MIIMKRACLYQETNSHENPYMRVPSGLLKSNYFRMKNLFCFWIVVAILGIIACNKDEESERFNLLTSPVWVTDSLLANGIDAGGPGGMLEAFKGEAKFDTDGTGTFGTFTGEWRFNQDETEITIIADSLALPIICDIVELTHQSLKITTVVPNPVIPQASIDIRMTFKPK